MKSRDTLMRAAKFILAERCGGLSCIDATITELRLGAQDLEQQIDAERLRGSVRDSNHFVFLSIAVAARKRRDKLCFDLQPTGHARAGSGNCGLYVLCGEACMQ